MFQLTMLPAGPGDALWVEYGEGEEIHRIVIDGGTPPTHSLLKKKIEALPVDQRAVELFILTHIDMDHIGGVNRLLSRRRLPKGFAPADFWFNELRHLESGEQLGAVDGEILGEFLARLGWRWNGAFQRGDTTSVPVGVRDGEGPPPTVELAGGMRVTLLAPGPLQLATLRDSWRQELAERHLDPAAPDYLERLAELMHRKGLELPDLLGDEDEMTLEELAGQRFIEDPSPANGSSIAVLLEFGEHSCLLTGDATPSAMVPAMRRLLRARGEEQLRVDAVKLPHHGSKNNLDAELMDLLASPRWLFSTNGSQHHHPDPQVVARIILANQGRRFSLVFNYPRDTNEERTKRWAATSTQEEWGYIAQFAADKTSGITIDLEAPAT
jgi:hypothetical protein